MMTDDLWQADSGSPMASALENARVRELVLERRWKVIGTRHWPGCSCGLCARFRGEFARQVVASCEKNGLTCFGQELRTPLRAGETPYMRRLDATRTRLRQFETGHNEFAWALCAFETAIAEQEGMALPPCAYETQGTLEVDA